MRFAKFARADCACEAGEAPGFTSLSHASYVRAVASRGCPPRLRASGPRPRRAALWIEGVWAALDMSRMANTVTVLDTIVLSVYGPAGFSPQGGAT
eukprot:gene2552-4248_t